MFTCKNKFFSLLLFIALGISGCGGGGAKVVPLQTLDKNQTKPPVSSPDKNETRPPVSSPENNISEVNLMKAQLGVLANATVKIYRLGSNQVRTLLYTEKTSNGDSLEKIGNFNGHIDVLEVDKFYLFEVEGGIDRDSNDDGILDVSGTVNYGTLRLIAKGSNLKVAKLARVTLASEMLYVQASKAILYDFENLESKLNSYIVDIIDEDLDGNGKIDMQDLLNFNPVTQASGLNNNYDMHAMTASILDNDLSYMNESNVSQVIGSYTIEDSDYYMSNLVLSPDGSTIYTIGSNYYRRYGLLSLDVTNKTSPKYLDNLNINIEQPKGITISNNGEKIFFADEYNGLQIVDSSNPESLKPFSAHNEDDYAENVVLSKDNTKAFISIAYAKNILEIVDIQNLENPTLIGSYESSNGAFNLKLSHDETKVFSLSRQNLQIIDVNDVNKPKLISELNTTEYVRDIALTKDDKKAFIAYGEEAGMEGILVLDISNVLNPQIIVALNTREDSRDSIAYAMGVVLSKDEKRLFVPHYTEGLKIIDVQNPYHPKLIKTIKTPGYAQSVVLSNDGKIAYVADESEGLQIIDVSLWSGE